MKRTILVVLFAALVLPLAAQADSVDTFITFTSGTFNWTANSASFTATLSNNMGTLTGVFPTFNNTSSGSFGAGGDLKWVSPTGSVIFDQPFRTGTWVMNNIGGLLEWQFTGMAVNGPGQNGFGATDHFIFLIGETALYGSAPLYTSTLLSKLDGQH
ncbi:MAG: hypothetical protein JWN74_809 [Acidobacteriaceae bacterium]|nr:hypothetical protein [Acidobacteriaceae bacterium]